MRGIFKTIIFCILAFFLIGNVQSPPVVQDDTALISILKEFPVHYLDTETEDQRDDRLTVISRSMNTAADHAVCEGKFAVKTCVPIFKGTREQMLILLTTTGFWESRFAQNIHEGKCRSWQCDPVVYRDIYGRPIKVIFKARTNWQLQYNNNIKAEWHYMQGTDQRSTDLAAWASAKMLSKGYNSCGDIWGAISKYAGVRGCRWTKGKKRLLFYERILREYEAK